MAQNHPEAPQDNPQANAQQNHVGVFGQAHTQNTLAGAHTNLYANFDAVNPSEVHNYMRGLNNIYVTQWLCFVVCTGGTASTITVLHSIALHKRNLQTKSKYNGSTFVFLHNTVLGKRASTVELNSSWFYKETVDISTYNPFGKAFKNAPQVATIDTTHTQENHKQGMSLTNGVFPAPS